MAFGRDDRGYREHYPRRGEPERYRRGRAGDEEPFRAIDEDDAEYARPSDRRHWRGHDYYAEDEYERDRDYNVDDRSRQGRLRAEHRERFLSGQRPTTYGGAGAGPWRGRQAWNEESSGPYAGRGPKGYRRTDERIHEDVCERLTEHPSIDASDIEVNVNEGDVTLTGRVESRAVKHLTEVMVETVSGVKEIHNQLRVAPPETGSWPDTTEERRGDRAPAGRRRG
jgi:osmotically-inducible protein OsmY